MTIARRDKKPLLLVHMETIHDFMSRLLDEFGETGEEGSVPAWRMSQATFKEFWDETVKGNRRTEQWYDENPEERRASLRRVNWDTIPSPC